MELVPTLPAAFYSRADIWRIEQDEIFAKSWIMVGVDSELRWPGAGLSEVVAGRDIRIDRGPDGRLQSVGRFECRVQTWRGFMFVCLDPCAPNLIEWLGEFTSTCNAVLADKYDFHSRVVRCLDANWKLYNDNFLEGYHLPTLHPELSREVDALNFVVECGVDDRWNVHTARPRRGDLWSGFWAYFYPCFSFNLFPGGLAIERWLPRGVNRTDLILEYFVEPDPAIDVNASIRACEEVVDQDVRICEMVQKNLTAGLYDVGSLSPKHENALAVFHDRVKRTVVPHL